MNQPVKTNVSNGPDGTTKDWIQSMGNGQRNLIVTVPHAGEQVPPEAPWLNGLSEQLLMYDVDRYVDQLYAPALQDLGIAWIKTHWHRYACDLNRLATDVDQSSVMSSKNAPGSFPRGLLWSVTTEGDRLMPAPIDSATYENLLERCFHPFHRAVQLVAEHVRPAAARHEARPLYHLDLHSMPSRGTKEHRDPGQDRADLVISNQDGKSSSAQFFDRIVQAGRAQGFQVSENWPYKGGRITEFYGRPDQGWETVQIELNRKLYMDEKSKRPVAKLFAETQTRLRAVLDLIANSVNSVS